MSAINSSQLRGDSNGFKEFLNLDTNANPLKKEEMASNQLNLSQSLNGELEDKTIEECIKAFEEPIQQMLDFIEESKKLEIKVLSEVNDVIESATNCKKFTEEEVKEFMSQIKVYKDFGLNSVNK